MNILMKRKPSFWEIIPLREHNYRCIKLQVVFPLLQVISNNESYISWECRLCTETGNCYHNKNVAMEVNLFPHEKWSSKMIQLSNTQLPLPQNWLCLLPTCARCVRCWAGGMRHLLSVLMHLSSLDFHWYSSALCALQHFLPPRSTQTSMASLIICSIHLRSSARLFNYRVKPTSHTDCFTEP